MTDTVTICECGCSRNLHQPTSTSCSVHMWCDYFKPRWTGPADEVPAGDRWSEGNHPDEPPAGPTPDVDRDGWDELGPIGSIRWRIGVLDKDQIEDPDAIVDHALLIAGWYVHDCAALLERLRVAEATIDKLSAELQRFTVFEQAILKAVEITYDTSAALAADDAVRALDKARAATTTRGAGQ